MNTNKFHNPESCDNCRILSNYESMRKEHSNSTKDSALRLAKLEILEKLIKDNKCPEGHNMNNQLD